MEGALPLRIVTVRANLEETFGNREYLTFKPLCLVPIQADLCVSELMTEKEKQWLKNYNKMCYECMKPLIQDQHVLEWICKQCELAEKL